LICGQPGQEVNVAICALDCTEEVVQEAIDRGAQLIIAHHPIVFSGLKSFTGKNYVERTVIKAIKNDIAIYALHTNLDAVHDGVNAEIGSRLGLDDLTILQPKDNALKKLYTFVPREHSTAVRTALFEAGAGHVGAYDHCSFNTEGEGTFRAGEGTDPFVGEQQKDHTEPELKIEVIFPAYLEGKIIQQLKDCHPYEEVAFDLIRLDNVQQQVGSGMIGHLNAPVSFNELLEKVAKAFDAPVLRHTKAIKTEVQRIAYCGGSGSFLLGQAQAAKADVFITGDFKYHQFFDAEDSIAIIDIGHFEFEQFTPHLIQAYLAKKFPTFAVLLSGVKTNPVQYFIS
jgi:dinuclear metal center YbgI/SA1388 family protein